MLLADEKPLTRWSVFIICLNVTLIYSNVALMFINTIQKQISQMLNNSTKAQQTQRKHLDLTNESFERIAKLSGKDKNVDG